MCATEQITDVFDAERFAAIFQELLTWRLDPYITRLEAGRLPGRIFPFARGLRFSARLIGVIREVLSDSEPNLNASWGQLIDEKNNILSPECDIIIHKRGFYRRWNGTDQPVMDFRFIRSSRAVTVISCKSYLRPSDLGKRYINRLKKAVDIVWLFAECCGPRSAENIMRRAKSLGYNDFWYLYSWSRRAGEKPNNDGWRDFIRKVSELS